MEHSEANGEEVSLCTAEERRLTWRWQVIAVMTIVQLLLGGAVVTGLAYLLRRSSGA